MPFRQAALTLGVVLGLTGGAEASSPVITLAALTHSGRSVRHLNVGALRNAEVPPLKEPYASNYQSENGDGVIGAPAQKPRNQLFAYIVGAVICCIIFRREIFGR